MKYSNKLIKKEYDNQILKAQRLTPITASVETMKLVKTLLPSFGSLGDAMFSKDRSLAFATCLNIFANNATIEHFETLQQLLLGSILNNNDEPLDSVANINQWLEAHDSISNYDLMIWLFSENLLQPLLTSNVVKENLDKFENIKDMFSGMFVELPLVEVLKDEHSEQA